MATTSATAPPTSATDIPSSPLPSAISPQTTQIIPGTTVIGTGTTGDVWSYTIPDVTSVIPISVPTSAPPNPPANTLVLTTVVVAGTTVTGGIETGVPWSYTIPDATFLSSVIVPVTLAPTSSQPSQPVSSAAPSSESLATPGSSIATSGSLTSIASDLTRSQSFSSSTPSSTLVAPTPTRAAQKSNAALSGGIVGGVLGILLLCIFAAALCLCLRLRRRRRAAGTDWNKPAEKGVGVIWGKGWGRNKKDRRAWGNVRPPMAGGDSGGSSGLGSRTRLNADLEAQETSEKPRPGARPRIKYPYPTPIPDAPESHNDPASPDDAYPADSSQYPQANSNPNDARSTSPNPTPPRPIPPPTRHVYAPPPPPPREPQRQPAPVPDLYRSTSPPRLYQASHINRPTSPHGSSLTSSTLRSQGPKRLAKQRANPSASAFLRHMVPARGASLHRSRSRAKAGSTPPLSDSESTARPGISTLPSFIRERQFSPGRDGLKSSSESALFSPRSTPRPLSPTLSHPHLAHARYPNYAMSRDGYLSPPSSFPRDRSSQLTSTTRSGGTGWSGATGRSGDSRVTGRSTDSRVTGRSARTGSSLGRVVEERRGWEEDTRG